MSATFISPNYPDVRTDFALQGSPVPHLAPLPPSTQDDGFFLGPALRTSAGEALLVNTYDGPCPGAPRASCCDLPFSLPEDGDPLPVDPNCGSAFFDLYLGPPKAVYNAGVAVKSAEVACLD